MKKNKMAIFPLLLAILLLTSCTNESIHQRTDVTDPQTKVLPCFIYEAGSYYEEFHRMQFVPIETPHTITMFGQSIMVSEYPVSSSSYQKYDLYTADRKVIGTVEKEEHPGTLFEAFAISVNLKQKENFSTMVQSMIQQYLPGSGAIDENTAKQLAWFYHQNLLQEDMKIEITEADFQGIDHDEYNGEIVNHSVLFILYKNGIQYARVRVTMDLNGILESYTCILHIAHPEKIPVFDGEEIRRYCENYLLDKGYIDASENMEGVRWLYITETTEGDFRFLLVSMCDEKVYWVTFEKIPGIKAINETEVAGSSGIEREP